MCKFGLSIILLVAMAGCSRDAGTLANTDWSLLGNSPEMQHHSDLAEINAKTVGRLGLAWWTEMPSAYGLVGNPLVQDGIVFQGGPGGQVFANDVRTGKQLWTFNPYNVASSTSLVAYISHQFNRGIALWKDKVIIATGDCHLFALDQKTGSKRWQATACDAAQMYGITAAPRVGEGLVFTGNTCMDTGQSRGHVDAFDAETGAHRWRFYTVPGDPSTPQDNALHDKAAQTWGTAWYGKSHGCGSVWDAITYDPKLHQVYIGVAGPAPLDPSQRAADAGDELFTNSVVALDARTGAYKWHFKQVPHDGWNFDSSVGIMVADLPLAGQRQRTVISVPKNGFAYLLDAATGKFISGKNFVDVNWAKGLDANGRPVPDPAAMYWARPDKSAVVVPSGIGAHGWEALAFDPQGNLLYIPAMVMPEKFAVAPKGDLLGALLDFYYGSSGDPQWQSYGELVAWDPLSQSARWRVRAALPINGGLLHTSGGLVFQGMAEGRLVAFDAATGHEAWSHQTGGAIRAAPSTVMVDGAQYIIVATGNGAASGTGSYVSRYNSTPESRTPPRLLAFRLGGASTYPPLAKVEPVAMPSVRRQDIALAKRGEALFEGYGCTACHGYRGAAVGGKVPNLNRIPPGSLDMFKAVVQRGALAGTGMPRFAELPDADAEALFAHVINEAWSAHEETRPH